MKPTHKIRSLFPSLPLLFHLIIWGTYFSYLWSRQYQYQDAGLFAGSVASWADGAAHLTFTSYLASHSLLPQSLPVYLSHPFTYPFAADWLSAVLVTLGLPLTFAFSLIGWILSLVLIYLLFRFYQVVLSNVWQAFIACQIFLFSGGLGFYYFIKDCFNNGFASTLQNLPQEYTHLEPQAIRWINLISSEFLPQRAFLLGFPIGLYLLIFCWHLLTKSQPPKLSSLIPTAILYGLLPIIHPHTFIVVSLVLGWIFILKLKQAQLYRFWFVFGFISSSIAISLMNFFIFPAATSTGFFKFLPGWLANTHQINWFWFWFLNWGIFPLIALAGITLLKVTQQLFLIPFVLIFTLTNLFLFQPYDWDNTKLLTYTYLALTAPVAVFLHSLLQSKASFLSRFLKKIPFLGSSSLKSLLLKTLALFLFFILIFSGLLDVYRLALPHLNTHLMFTSAELQLAQWVKHNAPSHAIFLTASTHNHFVPVLTGRQILMGYPGWLWTYGIDYSHRQQQIQSIYSGDSNALSLIQQYQIDYIVIGPYEISEFSPNLNYFQAHFQPVITLDNYTIYSTRPPLKPL